MDVKQEPFDLHEGVIKIEPDFDSVQTEETASSSKPQTCKNEHVLDNTADIFQSQEFVDVGEIKKEIFECAVPKVEQHSGYVCPINIKEEPNVCEVKASDLYVNILDIKQEECEVVHPKTESGSLTTHCDLPTLKDETTDYPDYFIQPSSSKQSENIFKSLQNTTRNVSKKKKKKRKYHCPICYKSFPSSKSRLNHIDEHFRKRPVKFSSSPRKKHFIRHFGKYYETCYYCDKFFLTKCHFLLHFFVFHYVKTLKNCNTKCKNNKYCKCINCLKLVKNKSKANIIVPTNNKNNFQCEICSLTLSSNETLKAHLKFHPGAFKCEICLKQFTDKCSLNYHLSRVHNEKKRFKCEICSKRFIRKSNLNDHLNMHTGERPFNCEICLKKFRYKSNLNYHIRIHSGKKRFICEICSAGFTRKTSLNKHLRLHAEEKPFKCDACSEQYSNISDLRTHLKIHQPTLDTHGKKQFKCEKCYKLFNDYSNMSRHLKIHTEDKPFKCEVCSKQFRTKTYLAAHLKTHQPTTQEKKLFKCEKCFKLIKSSLTRHLRVHTGEKPFKCKVCSKEFAYSPSLKRHIKIHKNSLDCT